MGEPPLRAGASNSVHHGLAQDDAEVDPEPASLGGGTNPFAAAVRATHMPMLITNPRETDNPIVFANDAFCRLTGYAREEIVGRNCRFLQGPETDPATVARIRAAVRAAQPIEIDIRNYRKTGEPFWNRLFIAPVHDASGTLMCFFASQIDVTAEHRRLAGLESDNAALGELAERQSERACELVEANRRLQAEIEAREKVEVAFRRTP